jgi:hypothetical protein
MTAMGLCCPLCGQPPLILVGERQAFCRTDDCPVFTWDTADTREAFLANANIIDLNRGQS